MVKEILTQNRLKELLHYSVISGKFYWNIDSGKRAKAGNIAGGLVGDGYVEIGINGGRHYAHRLVFLYLLGYLPDQGDHVNGIKSFNGWINLRAANNTVNQRNIKLPITNTSGFLGVYQRKGSENWIASIKVDLKNIHLGCFTDKAAAIAARKAANIKYGFHENHGRRVQQSP